MAMQPAVEVHSSELSSHSEGLEVNSHPGPTAALVHNVDVPLHHLERLFLGSNAPARRLELAVRPYRLKVTEQPRGARLIGDELAVMLAGRMIERIATTFQSTGGVDDARIADAISSVVHVALKRDLAFRLIGLRQPLRPVSLSQVAFMNAILHAEHALTFGIGPTGTGKTHLAVAAGLNHVAESRFKSMIITKPHVRMEGEILTPETRADVAYDDQFAPIEDVLHDLAGHDEVRRLSNLGMVEVMPLGRLRGRTFNETFIVIDEAQNMTVRKMRMAVTRVGRASRMVITGDPTQHDLPPGEISGLGHLLHLIEGSDLAFVHQFQTEEVIRTDLVARLEALYSRDQASNALAAA